MPATADHPATEGFPILAFLAGLALSGAANETYLYFFFAQPPAFLAIVLIIVASVLTLSCLAIPQFLRNGMGLLGGFMMASLVLMASPWVTTSANARHAHERLLQAASAQGRTPKLMAPFQQWTRNISSAMPHRIMIEDIAGASADPGVVASHLVLARSLGTNAQFVSDNGLVREQDRRALALLAEKSLAGKSARSR